MVVNIHNLIAAVNPEVYCDKTKDETGKKLSDTVKEIVKKEGHLKAAEKAKPLESEFLHPDEDAYYYSTAEAPGLKNPIEKHTLVYDAPSENLEPIYFWIFDYLQNNKYKSIDKLIDNFISSAGSGHFSEMGMKATKMQEEAMKMLGAANQVIKSILNILYDLKEFKSRLEMYDRLESKDENTRQEGLLSLKQVWMDTVDMKRGNSSIKAMALSQAGFVTLIDGFMTAKNTEEVNKMDLNERVKKILYARISEFDDWLGKSRKELEKRFRIEKIYLKSQVNSVQLYARWIKPYLNAAKALEQRQWVNTAGQSAELVTNFSTTLFELVLFCEGEYKVEDDVGRGDLPDVFKKKNERGYKPVIVVEYRFRTIPGKVQGQNYTFRGKIEVIFTSYGLNKDEIKIIKDELRKSDMDDLSMYIEGATKESLDQLWPEINEYLNEEDKKDEREKKEKEKESQDINPFGALMGIFTRKFWLGEERKKKDDKPDLSKGIPGDNQWEKIMRSQAIFKGRIECSKLYGEFKKAQNMVG